MCYAALKCAVVINQLNSHIENNVIKCQKTLYCIWPATYGHCKLVDIFVSTSLSNSRCYYKTPYPHPEIDGTKCCPRCPNAFEFYHSSWFFGSSCHRHLASGGWYCHLILIHPTIRPILAIPPAISLPPGRWSCIYVTLTSHRLHIYFM